MAALAITYPKPLDYDERLGHNEIQVARLQGSLAKALGVPTEAVDLVVTEKAGDLIVESAVIYLSPRDIDRMTRA